jgi:hypothetical protein
MTKEIKMKIQNHKALLFVVLLIALISCTVCFSYREVLDKGVDKLKKEKMALQEVAAIGELKMITAAELEYQAFYSRGIYASLEQLYGKGLIDSELKKGEKGGYHFVVSVLDGGNAFEVTAVPSKYRETGEQSYYVDQTSVIRWADKKGAPADASDETFAK